MKPTIVLIEKDNNEFIEITKEAFEAVIDKAYEAGKADAPRYYPVVYPTNPTYPLTWTTADTNTTVVD